MPSINRQIQLAGIPKDKLGPEHFKLAQVPMPQAGVGELLLKIKMISLDAANRAWMQGATYRAALEAGQVMAGGSLSEVIESQTPVICPLPTVPAGVASVAPVIFVSAPAKSPGMPLKRS